MYLEMIMNDQIKVKKYSDNELNSQKSNKIHKNSENDIYWFSESLIKFEEIIYQKLN